VTKIKKNVKTFLHLYPRGVCDKSTGNERNEKDDKQCGGWLAMPSVAAFIPSASVLISLSIFSQRLSILHVLLSAKETDAERLAMRPFVGRPWPLVYRKNHGVVELCAFKQHLSILYFLLGAQKTEEHRAAIWCRLVRMARRHIDIDATLALRTLKMMTEPPPPPPPPPTHDLELVVRSLLSCFNHIRSLYSFVK